MSKKNSGNHSDSNDGNSNLYSLYPPGKRQLIQKAPESLSIGKRLRRERYLRKLTLEQMANYLDISASYLAALERGSRPISRRIMDLLHRKLDLSYDFMLEGISITGTTVSKYVKESSDYTVKHNLNVLLNVCDEKELESCYEMIHTFLTHSRDLRSKDPVNPSDPENTKK